MIKLEVSEQEFDTILAALRFWQRKVLANDSDESPVEYYDIAADHTLPQEGREVDALCERINA
jgi:hypothetical protein